MKIIFATCSFSQFLRFLRRGADGADHGGAELAFFQRVQAFNRRAAGAGDLILERAGCWPVSKTIFAPPKTVLRGELRRDVARQSGGDTAVAQRLDELIDVSRAAAAQASHGVEQIFFDLQRDADSGQKFFSPVRRRQPSRIFRAQIAEAASPTSAGVFGMTRITRAPAGRRFSNFAIVTPAAIEISK